jgi:hypothetical protein
MWIVLIQFRLVVSQPSEASVLYWVSQSEREFTVLTVNTDTGLSSEIGSIPSTTSSSIRQLIQTSGDELPTPNSFGEGFSSADLVNVLESRATVSIQDTVVSPDQQKIAIGTKQQECIQYPRIECIGVIQVLIIDRQMQQRVVFTMSMNSSRYFTHTQDQIVREAFIRKIDWMPDQQSLVIQIGDDFTSRNQQPFPMLVVSLDTTFPPILINAAHTFSIDVQQNSIVTLTHKREITALAGDTINSIWVDWRTGQISTVTTELQSLITNGEIISINNVMLFWITSTSVGDWGGSFGTVETGDINSIRTFASPFSQLAQIRVSARGNVVIAQAQDGTLWQLTFSGDDMQSILVSNLDTSNWRISNDGSMIFAQIGPSAYQTLDLQSKIISSLNLSQPFQSFSDTESSILLLDG